MWKRTDGIILHKARLRRIKAGLRLPNDSCWHSNDLAGEEFGDEHDLFDSQGKVTQEGGKQVDPVNYSRFDEPDRRDLFEYVRRLVHLRTSHPALSVNDTKFIHVDFEEGKRVLVWKRGYDADPVVVVANFSDFTTANALQPGSEYSSWKTLERGDAKRGRSRREDRSAQSRTHFRLGGQGLSSWGRR